jgi:predicted nucleotidyltransferase component of viral defense system
MKYATPVAFRNGLDAKLRELAKTQGRTLDSLQRRVAFERFLARLFFSGEERWTLKGGYALELRLGGRARTTLDIDLNVPPPPIGNLLGVLQEAAERDLGDHFDFALRRAKYDLQGPPLGGERFQVEALLGKPYTRFVLDVGQGDVTSSPPECMTGQLDLNFAGLEPTNIWVYPSTNHFAEKLHAYTKPRDVPTRIKDLLDMALMLEENLVTASPSLELAVKETFERYATHRMPELFPAPPEEWKAKFESDATAIALSPTEMNAWVTRLQTFYQTVIGLEQR